MKTLAHNQQIKMAQFLHNPVVTVGTLEGYVQENSDKYGSKFSESIEDAMARAKKNNHDIAWTNQSAACLTADYKGKAEDMARRDSAYDNATVLENGEAVEIEGRKYIVKFMGDFSDPVHFIPTK